MITSERELIASFDVEHWMQSIAGYLSSPLKYASWHFSTSRSAKQSSPPLAK
jgi:hypothetical protein